MMSIMADEYAANLQGFAVVDCVVRSRRILYFVAREKRFDADDSLPDHAAAKRVVVCIRDKPEGKRWSHGRLQGMAELFGGSSERPVGQFVGVDAEGDVYVLGSGAHRMEEKIPAGPTGPRRGRVRRVRQIDGEAYVVSSKRGLARRVGPEQWQSLCPPIERMPTSRGEEYEMTRDWGFEDADGYSVDDLYAVGGRADLWHLDADSWRQIRLDVPLRFESVCCGGDGVVYIGAQSGVLLAGRGDRWQLLDEGSSRLPYHDLVWHDGSLYGANVRGLWQLHDGRMRPVELPAEVADCCGHLCAREGALLMAGEGGAAVFEDGTWSPLFRAADHPEPTSEPVQAAPWSDVLRGRKCEAGPASAASTWPAALSDYVAMLDAKRRALGADAPAGRRERLDGLFGCRREVVEDADALAAFVSALGARLPVALRELWAGHGAFGLLDAGCWNSLTIHPLAFLQPDRRSGWPGLYEAFRRHGVGAEFERHFTPEQNAILREHYWVFGRVQVDDSDFDLLVFDRDGRAGCVRYRHDWLHFNGDAWQAEYEPLLRGEMRVIDLDAELAARIARCRTGLESWDEER